MSEQERLGISDETMKSMRQFFLKYSVPKLVAIEREKKEGEQDEIRGNAEMDRAI